MSKKLVKKISIVFALCGLLLLTLLTSGVSASAQNVGSNYQSKPVVNVVNAKTVAPHRSVVVQTFCPFRYRAQSSQVKVFHPARPNIYFLARNAYTIQSNKPLAWRLGWTSKVHNNSGLSLRVQVTTTCVFK